MAMLDYVDEKEETVSLSIPVDKPMLITQSDAAAIVESEEKKKRKKRKKLDDGTEIISRDDDLPMTMTNEPYKNTYQETDTILRTAIMQLDTASVEIGEDLDEIRASKTMRKKYDYIAALQSSRATLISNKIAAAREMNNSIKNSHELELKRAKDLKMTNETDDKKSIQDLYSAFINTPMSQNATGTNYSSPFGPTTQDFTLPSNNLVYSLVNQSNPDAGYQNYLNNMSVEQQTMLMEENPHINQVVVYDPATGNASFAIYDSERKSFLDNVPTKSNEMFMPGMQFDFNNMQAHSNDLNETYEIIMMDSTSGSNSSALPMNPRKDMDKY